jgi:hypothetical protein
VRGHLRATANLSPQQGPPVPSDIFFKHPAVTFKVCKSVDHHTIQINQPTRCNSLTSLLLDVYVWLHVFRASPRQSSGAYNCTRSLWFYRWQEEAGALLVVVWPVTTAPGFTVGRKRLERCWSWGGPVFWFFGWGKTPHKHR